VRLSIQGNRFVVFDDVLSSQDLATVQAWHSSLRFERQGAGDHVTRHIDGVHYRSDTWVYPAQGPVDSPVDDEQRSAAGLAMLLRQASAGYESLVGKPGEAWQGVSVTGAYTPAGGRLPWHDDGAGRTGAYILYVHPHWDSDWGGELMIVDEAKPEQADPADASTIGSTVTESRALLAAQETRFVFPAPNRLVVFAGGTLHSVARVDSSTGKAVRAVVSGSFLDGSLL
jgi:hypothetical protein